MRRNRLATFGLAAIVALVGVYYFTSGSSVDGGEAVIPELSEAGGRGQVAYGQFCASCHGGKAEGTDKGPPFIHPVYNPGHHGDASFVAAARRGAKAHHWPFGDMKPVDGISDAELADVIMFIREVQKANGLF